MKKPSIMIEVAQKKGNFSCHHGHKVGDTFDFDQDRGRLCPMAMHALFPYIDILRYGGAVPVSKEHADVRVCCPDPDVINVFIIHTQRD